MGVFQKGWEDISLEEYIEIEKIFIDNVGILNRSIEILCYLTDSDHYDDMDIASVLKEYKELTWINNKPMIRTPKFIGEYKLKPFDKFTLSEWIDLDEAINGNNISQMASLIYRKYEEDKWGNIEYEPYKFSLKERSLFFMDIPITELYGIRDKSIEYRDKLMKSFSTIFENYEDENLSEDEKEMLSEGEIREIQNSIKKDNEKRNYAWMKLLDDISGGIWSHIPEILELPHTFIFNMLLTKKIFNG